MAVNLTRAVGQTMARLADWEVATLVHRVQELEAGDDATGSRATTALRMVDALNEPFEELLVYVWRRHLAAAVSRVEALGANEEDLHTTQVTVGFADIVASPRSPTGSTTTGSATSWRSSSPAAPTWSPVSAAGSSRASATRCSS